ncbi:MAG TPA: hypothetical protein VK528_03715 [Flavobacterium sp.]|nr:hypothetical protein [Flavobacterium sp.]
MKLLKNISVGFLVSFLGSLPLGYINVIGAQVYKTSGMQNLVLFILGVITVEAVVIYATLVFAEYLARHEKIIKYIEFFSIFFMLLIGYLFFRQSDPEHQESYLFFSQKPAFLLGISFNAVNFLQLPFWVGWNLYVTANNYISRSKPLRLFYVFGTLCGSFAGIFAVALLLYRAGTNGGFLGQHLMPHIIPLFFVGMAVYQAVKYYRKYYRMAAAKD